MITNPVLGDEIIIFSPNNINNAYVLTYYFYNFIIRLA